MAVACSLTHPLCLSVLPEEAFEETKASSGNAAGSFGKSDQSERLRRFEDLWRKHFESILKYALRRGWSDHGDDIAARTFTVAWRKIDHVPENAAPWLYGVARKVMLEEVRSESRRKALWQKTCYQYSSRNGYDGTIASDATHELVTAKQDQAAAIVALLELSERDREIVTLVAWEGLSVKDVATALGMTASLVSLRLHRARSRLRKLREQYEQTEMQGMGGAQ